MQYTLFGAIDIGSSEMELKIFELSRGKGMREIDCIRNRLELEKTPTPPERSARRSSRSSASC